MANDQQIVSDEPDPFLDRLLRYAFTVPGASTSPTAGRILARLLAVGAVEGGDEFITPYLVPVPGEEATFEVRTYSPGDLVPMEVREGLGAAAALKIALRGARDSNNGIEVVSLTSSGLERCALVRDSTGDFEFRFAAPETMIGSGELCAAAFADWADLLTGWRDEVLAERGGTDAIVEPANGQPRAPRTEVGSDVAQVGLDHDTSSPGPTESRWAPAAGDDESGQTPSLPPRGHPSPNLDDDGQFAAATEARDEATTPEAPTSPAPTSPAPMGPTSPTGPVTPAAQAPPELGPDEGTALPTGSVSGALTSHDLNTALRSAIGGLVVEVDLGQVEQLIRRVIDDDRREMVEPLARRLAARLEETLRQHDTRALVEAVSEVLPQPGDLAEAVASDVGALLSETILRRRPGDTGMGMDTAGVMGGIERLHIRVDSLEDQFRKTAGMLYVLSEHLDAGDRRAAIAERITVSVDQEMQRLANRIDEQVSALAASAGGGSELSDGIARLTRKMRQSVVELDRALARLDQVMDRLGGERGNRLGLAAQGQPAEEPVVRRSTSGLGLPRRP